VFATVRQCQVDDVEGALRRLAAAQRHKSFAESQVSVSKNGIEVVEAGKPRRLNASRTFSVVCSSAHTPYSVKS
jgi:hypothetical protein